MPCFCKPPPLFASAMAFCCERPAISLAGPGDADTFIAEVFKPRPSFDGMVRFQSWGSEANQKMREAMNRKRCAVGWVQLVADQCGVLALLKFQHEVQLGDAKKAAKVIFGWLPKEQHCAVQQGLRPLDEVDRDRLAEWMTIESLRPKGQTRKCVDEEDEAKGVAAFFVPRGLPTQGKDECAICLEIFGSDKPVSAALCGHVFHSECLSNSLISGSNGSKCPICRAKQPTNELANSFFLGGVLKRKRSEEEEPQPHNKQARSADVARLVAEGAMKAPTLEEYMAQASSDEESEAELEPPRLMLTDGATSAARAPLNYDDPASVWEHRVKTEATIVLAEAGTRPEALKFKRCHREDRRQILLQSRVRKEFETPTLLSVVRVAMQLAKEEAMPGVGKHGRRSEFMERCSTALASLNPDAEGVLTSLSIREQALIRSALGGEGPPYEGCFSPECMDKEPSWTERDLSLPYGPRMVLSRCSRCNMPKNYGRTFSMQAVVDVFEPKGRKFHTPNRL